MSFFEELKRRNFFCVGIAYVISAWVLLLTIDPDRNDGRSERWHLLKLLGRDREADDELRMFADSGIPFQIADLLV